jgi:hypothetical protein
MPDLNVSEYSGFSLTGTPSAGGALPAMKTQNQRSPTVAVELNSFWQL